MSELSDFAAVMAFDEAPVTLPARDRRSPIPWTPEAWDAVHRKKRRGGDLVNPVVADDPALRRLLRGARWEDFDRIIVQFSGGKDSVASLLWLLEAGAPRDRIELWHQNVDGDHDSPAVFDWPLTQSYVESFAQAFGLPLLYQFRIGGLAGEIERSGRSMEDTVFESPLATSQGLSKLVKLVGRKAPNKHRKYELGIYRWATSAGYLEGRQGMPIKSAADMKARYCTSTVKIEPANAALRYDPRFSKARLGRVPKLLVVTGERREEGGNRAAYSQVQWHPTHAPTRRVVVHWRSVLHLDKVAVYKLLQRWKVQPSPVYELGVWGRCSCSGCIFSSKSQWAGLREVLPDHFDRLVQLERRIDRAGKRTLERRKRPDGTYFNVPLDEWVPSSVKAASEQWKPSRGRRRPPAELDRAGVKKWMPYLQGKKRFTPKMVFVDPWVLPPSFFLGEEGGSPNRVHHHPGCPLARGRAAREGGPYLRDPVFTPRTIEQRYGFVWRGRELTPRQADRVLKAIGGAAQALAPHAHMHPLLWDLVDKTGYYQRLPGAVRGASHHWQNSLGMTQLEVEALFVAVRLMGQGRGWELDALQDELIEKEAGLEDVGDYEPEPLEMTVEDLMVEEDKAIWVRHEGDEDPTPTYDYRRSPRTTPYATLDGERYIVGRELLDKLRRRRRRR